MGHVPQHAVRCRRASGDLQRCERRGASRQGPLRCVTDPRRVVGQAGEDAVARWYAAAGYTVLDRNWRVREGELDLVVRDASTIAFCEVKTRRGDAFGMPAEAVERGHEQRRA